ncbi:radical SAM protein [Clostridium scatologenes]|uniref:Heme chaperone HemW n=1 Tax=Clostridium scatologenes TaxID=1548 RepID=A0A0E3GPW5_CLOSL|nr:radical SAM protein [Clostridium scatologenes]AKA67531.1 oxygen-independent coproporphyrinogen III oxidase [Clostridium scatologenes]
MITNLLRLLFTRSLKPFIFTNENKYKFDMDVPELGIYVHIPFCTTLCPFCPYNKVKYDKTLAASYKDALIKEIQLVSTLNRKKTHITSVYFGGGSPALMLEHLPEILNVLRANFHIKSNIGIELHPRDINTETLVKLKNIGFNMVSIGIQSFEEKYLNILGREYINGAEKVKMAAAAGFTTIDVDLMFGIKSQSKESLKNDFITAFNSGATQVSTYPFIDFSYANNKSKPLGKKHKKELLEYLEAISGELQCIRTSVWTFGKKGIPKYSSITRDSFIGFGPSATTLLNDFFKVNTFSVVEYIKCINNEKIPTSLTLSFNKKTRALYWLFWNSYTLKINNKKFKKLFNTDLDYIFKFELQLGMFLGLIRKTNESYELTKKGTYKYHLVEQAYTHQYIDKTWRIAQQEAWPDKINLY